MRDWDIAPPLPLKKKNVHDKNHVILKTEGQILQVELSIEVWGKLKTIFLRLSRICLDVNSSIFSAGLILNARGHMALLIMRAKFLRFTKTE